MFDSEVINRGHYSGIAKKINSLKTHHNLTHWFITYFKEGSFLTQKKVVAVNYDKYSCSYARHIAEIKRIEHEEADFNCG